MRRFLLALAFATALALPAFGQAPQTGGPTNQSSLALIAPTAPAAANNNQIATTAWVNSWAGTAMPLASGKIWIGSAGNLATPQTFSGDGTLSVAGAFTLVTAQPAVHTWALAQTFTVAPVFTDQSGSRTALGLGNVPNVDMTNLSNAVSGTAAAARGGAGTISGALKGNGAGVVSQAATTDLSDVTSGSWTPTDQSGAGVTFTCTTACKYTRIGNMIHAYGTIVVGASASGNNSLVGGLPVAVPNSAWAVSPGAVRSNLGPVPSIISETVQGSSNFRFYNNASGGPVTDAQIGGATITLMIIYPAS